MVIKTKSIDEIKMDIIQTDLNKDKECKECFENDITRIVTEAIKNKGKYIKIEYTQYDLEKEIVLEIIKKIKCPILEIGGDFYIIIQEKANLKQIKETIIIADLFRIISLIIAISGLLTLFLVVLNGSFNVVFIIILGIILFFLIISLVLYVRLYVGKEVYEDERGCYKVR